MLVTLGARHIVVISRSGKPPAGKAQQSLEKWNAAGIEVDAQAADMADFERLKVPLFSSSSLFSTKEVHLCIYFVPLASPAYFHYPLLYPTRYFPLPLLSFFL